MLKEIALTPQVFDPEHNPDRKLWSDSIDALAHGLFPRNSAPPVVAADLRGGDWFREVGTTAIGITDQDQAIKWKVQGLIRCLKNILVERPTLVKREPSDEQGWADEAVCSHSREPINLIVLTDGLLGKYQSSEAPFYSLRSVKNDSFWSGIQNPAQVPMDIEKQVAILRPICLHAGYLALKLPHAWGTDNDETPFAAAVFDSAFRRPEGFARVHAELHVAGQDRGLFLEPTARENIVKNIRHVLGKTLPTGSKVLLCLWPHFVDRKLIAGRLTTSAGNVLPSPKWGISFSHVARPRDDAESLTTWSLIPPHDLRSFSRDVDANSSAVLYQEILRF